MLTPRNWFRPSSKIFLLTVSRRHFFCGSFFVFVSCVSHAFASVPCCLMVTCWERTDLLALVGDVYFIFLTFPCGIMGEVWYLIVSLPDLCLPSYFYRYHKIRKAFSKFYHRNSELIVKYNIGLKALLQEGISEPIFIVI